MNRRPNNNNGNNTINPVQEAESNRPRRGKRPPINPAATQSPEAGSTDRIPKNAVIPSAQIEPVTRRGQTILKRYGIIFFETHALAREDNNLLLQKKAEVDQLNIVIRAEGSMDDPELLKYGKVYAGEAWHLIHTRRVDDGWYNEPHE